MHLITLNIPRFVVNSNLRVLSTFCRTYCKYVEVKCPDTKPAKKQNLLKFPALPLEETIPKFLKTVRPLLTDEEYCETKKISNEFQAKEGVCLQKLLEKAAASEDNWLAKRWLNAAYMSIRDPVTMYTSPAMTFPLTEFKCMEDYYVYTAKVIMGMIKFKKLVDDGMMPIVKIGKNELDNSQFGVVYGTTRIPELKLDKMQYNPKSKHIVVISKNHFFKLPVYNKSGEIVNASILAEQLKEIVDSECSFGPPIGILTNENRDNWAEAYADLSKSNCKAIKCIQSALFTVSLDQEVEFEENKLNTVAHQLTHGGGSQKNSANRWMDKTIQIIVNPNGISGFCYEHSPAEGQPIALMTEYITKILPKATEFESGSCEDYEQFSKLKFNEPSKCLLEKIKKASINIDKLSRDQDFEVLQYKSYGKEFLKEQKMSPDSFIQMALQYAFYKLHKFPGAQYESAHLRLFYNGRTETIRSCSSESVAFAHAMMDPAASDATRANILREAVNGHRQYTNMALQGRGVDRHLLGLKLMALENNKPVPRFFSTPGYLKSLHFYISTSQVATKNAAFMAYGTAIKDGYGCCYNPRANDMFFAVCSWFSCESTSSPKFAEAIADALDRMRRTLLNASGK